mgnify:CR=1 FL=1
MNRFLESERTNFRNMPFLGLAILAYNYQFINYQLTFFNLSSKIFIPDFLAVFGGHPGGHSNRYFYWLE